MDGNTQERAGIPERSIFPVGKESVDKALAEIVSDPTKALVHEKAIMGQQSPALLNALTFYEDKLLSEGSKANYFDFMEGAYWTHKILRMQAETCGRELPQISLDLILTNYRDSIQKANEQDEKKEVVPYEEKIKKMTDQDPEFERAIKEFTKYRTSPTVFYNGVINVYTMVRDALQAEELARKLDSIDTVKKQPDDEFLKRVTTEREPLSEEEKKEAMAVAGEIRQKAMDRRGDRDCVSLRSETPKVPQRITLYSGDKIKMHNAPNPATDLVIMVSEDESRIVHKYFFAPDKVIKTTFDLTGVEDINMGDSDIREQAKQQLERRTEETYFPDKADLFSLFLSLSSAREVGKTT